MALFEKLFTRRKLEHGNHEARKRDRSYQIAPEQVRLLLFKECDWRGRKLLFDSSTIERVPSGKHDKPNRQTDETPCIVEVADGFTYVYKGPAADASVLGEMIFGAVAMNYKSVSLKIHFMEEPRRLMCTKIFCVPTSRRISRVEKKNEGSSGDVRNSSKPLNVQSAGTLSEEGVSLSFSLDRGDSGFCGDQSPYSSVGSTYDYFSMFDIWDGNNSQDDLFFHTPPGRKLSTSSNGSWQRRTFQNIATRFEVGHRPSSSSNLLSVPTATSNATFDSQIFSSSSPSGTNESLVSSGVNFPQRKNKLGLALLITVSDHGEMDEVRRCVEHSPQLQALVCRLRLATLAAGTGCNFVSTLHKAATDAAKWLSDLLYGPRLQPRWLSLVGCERRAALSLADTLLTDLCSVLAVADTKHTNFFISTLLTHVLTYHLGWVTTVSPYDTLDPQKHGAMIAEAKRPYNALWAQLSDLCGTIGFPPRAARTIICGTTNIQFIERLLAVLTYFMRSGDVKRREYQYRESPLKETKVISVNVPETSGLKRTTTVNRLHDLSANNLCVALNTQDSDSVSTLANEGSMKRSVTMSALSAQQSGFGSLRNLSQTDCPDSGIDTSLQASECKGSAFESTLQASNCRSSTFDLQACDSKAAALNSSLQDSEYQELVSKSLPQASECQGSGIDQSLQALTSDSSLQASECRRSGLGKSIQASDSSLSSSEPEPDRRVVFVLGDDERLVGLKNKSVDGKSGKRSSRVETAQVTLPPANPEPVTTSATPATPATPTTPIDPTRACYKETCEANASDKPGSPSKCCAQTLQHSKPIKHSGFKFEFDKYPQIVTNYIKSKNLEILDRHYIGKPGNLKLANLQLDPTVVPPIQEERCEICYKCQQMESLLQTPTNASEMEYMNDIPRQAEPQHAIESTVDTDSTHREVTPKTFVRKRKKNTIVVNIQRRLESPPRVSVEAPREGKTELAKEKDREKAKPLVRVKQVIEFPMPCMLSSKATRSGFDTSLLGGVTDHYVPDLILQGTYAEPRVWESELRRDLDLTAYLNKGLDPPLQAVAIIGDTNTWEVRVVGRECGAGGMSSLVGAMLDALPAMRRARVPVHQCLHFLEGKLREFCVLSKTLADMLMTTDFCDIATLTRSLNIDASDVPLLLAVATTHTPLLATRYGISYR